MSCVTRLPANAVFVTRLAQRQRPLSRRSPALLWDSLDPLAARQMLTVAVVTGARAVSPARTMGGTDVPRTIRGWHCRLVISTGRRVSISIVRFASSSPSDRAAVPAEAGRADRIRPALEIEARPARKLQMHLRHSRHAMVAAVLVLSSVRAGGSLRLAGLRRRPGRHAIRAAGRHQPSNGRDARASHGRGSRTNARCRSSARSRARSRTRR